MCPLIYQFINLSIFVPIYPSIYLSIYLATCLTTYHSFHQPVPLSMHPSICPPTYLSTYLSACLCLSVYPSLDEIAYLPTYLYIYRSIYLSTCLSTYAKKRGKPPADRLSGLLFSLSMKSSAQVYGLGYIGFRGVGILGALIIRIGFWGISVYPTILKIKVFQNATGC